MLGERDFVDGAWTPGHWWRETYCQEKEDQLYGVYGPPQGVEVRDTCDPPSILTPDQCMTVEEILNVTRRRLQDSELRPACMLTHGTAVQEPFDLAFYIARQLRLECTVIVPHSTLDSRVGRWSGQLHRLREYPAGKPRVLVLGKLDEFCNSALVKDSWRAEELKCIRDRFLKALSMLELPTVVVACTNLEMELDPEDWERFTDRMELNAADPNPWLLAARIVARYISEGYPGVPPGQFAKDWQTLRNPTDSRG